MGRHEAPKFDAYHVHGNGEECFPGCPAYDIAKAWRDTLCGVGKEVGYEGQSWESLPERRERLEKTVVQDMLDKGVIAQPGVSADFLGRELAATLAKMDQLAEVKNSAYHERNMLVAALSKVFAAHTALHPAADTEWEPDWRTIICVHLPTGQATWHVHDGETDLFAHLPFSEQCKWDGHTTMEKYDRLRRLRPGVTA